MRSSTGDAAADVMLKWTGTRSFGRGRVLLPRRQAAGGGGGGRADGGGEGVSGAHDGQDRVHRGQLLPADEREGGGGALERAQVYGGVRNRGGEPEPAQEGQGAATHHTLEAETRGLSCLEGVRGRDSDIIYNIAEFFADNAVHDTSGLFAGGCDAIHRCSVVCGWL